MNPVSSSPQNSQNLTDPKNQAVATHNYTNNGNAAIAHMEGHVIICGLANRGYRILQQLREARLGVVVIDNKPDPRFAEEAQHDGVPILQRDSRTDHALLEAGVTRALALIAVTDNDLHNLEIILAAQKLSPNLRTVASFYNQNIGEQLIQAIPNATALSSSQLAAPAFVTASLSSPVLHTFRLETEEMAVVVDRVGRDGTLQELYGRLTPIMRQSGVPNSQQVGRGAEPMALEVARQDLCPPPNVRLKQGDLVTLIGREDELVQQPEVDLSAQQVAEAKQGRNSKSKRRNRSEKLSIQDFIVGLWRDVDRPLRSVLGVLSLVLLFSTAFFMLVSGRGLVDGFYLVLRVIGSNGEFDNEPNKIWLELFSSVLIVVGTALLATVYGYITNFIVSARLRQALGQQKATTMKDHVVLCGLGGVGYEVLRSLRARGEDVAVLEIDEKNRYTALIRNMGVPVIHADARVAESLDLVNIAEARCLTIMTNDDLANLETALNAKAKAKGRRLRVVMRFFDPDMAEKAEKTFGISLARSTSALVAPYFVAAVLDFEVVTSFYVGRTPFVVVKLCVEDGSGLSGLRLREVYTRAKVLVLAYWGAEIIAPSQEFIAPAERVKTRPTVQPDLHPTPELVLKAGDIIYCVGPYENLSSVYQLNKPATASISPLDCMP